MTVVLKPLGPGTWKPMQLVYDGKHMPPMLVRVGERLQFGGMTWRVCAVLG